MLWHDLRSEVPLHAREPWDQWWDGPLDSTVDASGVDVAVLDSLIEMGQAVDRDDARAFVAHQERLAGMSNALERAAANAEFAAARRARLSSVTATRDPTG